VERETNGKELRTTQASEDSIPYHPYRSSYTFHDSRIGYKLAIYTYVTWPVDLPVPAREGVQSRRPTLNKSYLSPKRCNVERDAVNQDHYDEDCRLVYRCLWPAVTSTVISASFLPRNAMMTVLFVSQLFVTLVNCVETAERIEVSFHLAYCVTKSSGSL